MLLGAMIDILLLTFMFKWTLEGGSWRFMIFLFLTYIFRQVFESLYKIRGPSEDQWINPGLYSLTVGYQSERYYYFNTALSVCIGLFFEY